MKMSRRKRKMLRRLISIAGLVLAYGAFASPVHANFFDRLKDIYETPERLQQLQDQYSHAGCRSWNTG